MKKILLTLLVVSSLTIITGCGETTTDTNDDLNINYDGLLILQAYGTGGKEECALSSSFVELYNSTNNSISLDGTSLQYCEEGNLWNVFELSGTILGNTSFLISFDTCEDAVNQIYTADLQFDWEINNKGIKFCLMDNNEQLDVVNPYESNSSGYIDMLCATDSSGTIDAAEGNYVIGQSKQKSLRRKSLIDTNDNSIDFEVIDYSSLTATNIEQYSPKNQTYGSHNPIITPTIEETDNTLLIYQVYGTGEKTDSAINRSYIELYNNSNVVVDLTGYSIQYMSYEEATWSIIELSGSIPAYSSYLIVGSTSCEQGVYGTINDEEADFATEFHLSNDGFAVCLLSNTTLLSEQTNPFDDDLDSYIDMVGSNVSYYEGNAAEKPSKQKTVIRSSFDDTNNNANDFITISFKDIVDAWNTYAPKSTSNGPWVL